MTCPAEESSPKDNTASTKEKLIHILYVDNEAGLLKAAKPILEIQGAFNVETAPSVEEAIKKMQTKTFDAIVCDYIMPGIDGLEFLKRLRDSGNSIPFIIFTGKGRETVAIEALNLGADQYINKVGKTEAVYRELAHGINTVVKGKRAEKALRDSEKEKSAVLNSMSELVLHQDLEHRILWTNKMAADSVGMKAENLEGRYCHELWGKSDKPCDGCPIEKTMKTGKPQHGERTTPDDRIWFINSSPIKDADGKVTSIVEVAKEITLQKKAENALQESEEKYRTMLEQAPDLIVTVNEKGIVTSCNSVLEKNTDFSRNEVVGKHFLETPLLQTVDLQAAQRVFKSVLEGKKPERLEIKWFMKDGTPHISEIRVGLNRKDGKIVGFTAVVRDITEYKKAEEKLQDSEEKFRNLAEKLPNMIFINKKGRVVYVNKRCEEIMGYTKEEFYSPNFNFFTLIDPECLERLKSSYCAHLSGEEIPPYEYAVITKDGKRIEAILTTKLIHYEGENAILGIITDITERKKTNEKLKESERKYRLLTENITDVIYIQDMNLDIIYASSSVKELAGYTPEEVMKLRPEELMTPESFERGVADFKEAITAAAGQLDYEIPLKQYEYVRKDGSTFWGELKMKLLRDSNNNMVAIQGTLRDITERKNAEKQLDELMNQLVTINEKLSVVGKLTRHDARNKLSVIANNIYLAKQKLGAGNVASEFLDDVESAVEQMEEIFEFSRTYEMLGVEDLSYMDVGSNVEEASMLLSGMKDVKLVNECRGLTVLADSLLRQLFYNLIDDTLKYGEKVSQIRVYYEEEEDCLKLVYEDDGVGIAENEKVNLFREGYGKSTGYGLYLIKKICREYGWIITETGVFGKGVQFTMTIPKAIKNGKERYRTN